MVQAYGGAHRRDRRLESRPQLERARPLADERLETVDDLATRCPRGRDERRRTAVGAVGEVDHGLPRLGRDQQLVAHRCRVHDQVAAARIGRPLAAPGEDAHLPRQRGKQGPRRAARADQADLPRLDPGDDLHIGAEAEHAAVAEDQGVDGVALGLVAERDHGLLVRNGHVRTRVALGDESGDGGRQLLRRDVLRLIAPVEPGRLEGRVLHPRRERLGDGPPEQRDPVHRKPCAALKRWNAA